MNGIPPEELHLFQFDAAYESFDDRFRALEKKVDLILEILQKPKRTVKRYPGEYTVDFNTIWALYPKRAGSNPKVKAFGAYKQRVKHHLMEDVICGVERYAAFCDATGKTGTELVMQAVRFFGPGCEFLNEWEVPKESTVIKVPSQLEPLIKFARERGIEARPGEDTWEFRKRVEDSL